MKDNRLPSSILIAVWVYTGLEKLIRFEESRRAFQNQVFPYDIADLLSYGVPILELCLTVLLLFSATRWLGFLASLILLSAFSTYIGLIWIEVFPRVPCNCAGIIESLGWDEHLLLNIILMLFASWGLYGSSPSNKILKGRGAVFPLPKVKSCKTS
ncbi:MAG: hypothetical protein P8O16_09710 [Algoriphagus sp.]|uniref:MauE/DoxX family redox-associated membrane protein n=1 Tax=Algoriphagus sp. TaxID=1872435 RepID=UPI002607CFAB|nr:MauE/DoxX family redox-associated membrane protein [Algoriphagus sp.]MDG1277544.1 hypothetical protein [Algoriphagus sp.]